MRKSIDHYFRLAFPAALLLAASLLFAGEPPAPKRAPRTHWVGNVVVVDRNAQTLTAGINGKIHLFKIGPNVSLVNKDKAIALTDLVAGQKITLTFIQAPAGDLVLETIAVLQQEAEKESRARASTNSPPAWRTYDQIPSVSPYQ